MHRLGRLNDGQASCSFAQKAQAWRFKNPPSAPRSVAGRRVFAGVIIPRAGITDRLEFSYLMPPSSLLLASQRPAGCGRPPNRKQRGARREGRYAGGRRSFLFRRAIQLCNTSLVKARKTDRVCRALADGKIRHDVWWFRGLVD
jgi:hypothetical protein